ncbi:MAG: alginate O-acetyltransferase AlgX-related protein [Bacteroidota bacterium]
MKRFILKILIFALPVLGWFIIEAFLPSHTFTYRPWEALMFQTPLNVGRTFHPNSEVKMKSEGELGHHTRHAVLKDEYWRTDSIGNRNDSFIKSPDVLIIGDSFIAGIAITQDSTITNQLQHELGNDMTVYNISPDHFYELDSYLKNKIIEAPQTVIYSIVERFEPRPLRYSNNIPAPDASVKTKIKDALKEDPMLVKMSILLDKSLRQYSKSWVQARISGIKPDSIPGIEGSNMFFLHGENQTYNEDNLQQVTNTILTYKAYCDSIGSNFIFLPMPNKETVYYDYVPFPRQPDYLLKLDSLLKEKDIQSINTLKLYNDYRQTHSSLLYHLDDTHWTPRAIRLVAKELAKTINFNHHLLVQEKMPQE